MWGQRSREDPEEGPSPSKRWRTTTGQHPPHVEAVGGPEDPSEARVDPGGGGTQTELTEDSARLEVLSAPTTAPPVSPPPAGPA